MSAGMLYVISSEVGRLTCLPARNQKKGPGIGFDI